ncbi:hypothetical protein COU78_05230 [Candidatus Peregrinibacteria bacterium CG10_big_fil_rev_8_21_14_0_10_49_24]|nr:MAG: hypothetical protein COV83_01600 [Candidatus Peregrinibacteria bacterium CG11_big_fil_rev_8_21_14_0_20_49_14]PIR50748.1 MAG: hypothetical protein COU78_05230 [Candidatus Peregrinibacteria bacterium CG10_big_fil_rev_8_21_14_0_10_49_24]PJA68207.1 MAG: hypothetical protein CO157_00580 [Candidatus Peregrinibacteria bacterium CG_4_9_14_3_um_filter_49_12]
MKNDEMESNVCVLHQALSKRTQPVVDESCSVHILNNSIFLQKQKNPTLRHKGRDGVTVCYTLQKIVIVREMQIQ